MNVKKQGLLSPLLMGISLALAAGQSIAQNSSRVLEEVIVTATKRAQAINDIPVAVSAYTNEQLKQSGIRDVSQLTAVSPYISFGTTENSASGSLSMRGIGTLGTDPGLESSVGVFIDGVYRNRAGVAIDELGEVERVEVLRGPQGSLFGRNTSAGLIHVVTKGPNTEEFEGFLEASAGNYNLTRISGAASGPIIEGSLAGRLDAVVTQRDGYLEDINSSDTYNDRDRYLVRGQLLWDMSDALSARIILDYSDRNEMCCGSPTSQKGNPLEDVTAFATANGDRGLDNNTDPYDYNIATSTGRESTDETEQSGISAELNWSLDSSTLTSITAFREWETVIEGDTDFSGADLLFYENGRPRGQKFETFTQELRLQGAWEGGSWLVGLFYADEKLSGKFAPRTGRDMNAYAERYVNNAVAPGFYAPATTYPAGVAPSGSGLQAKFINGEGINDEGEQNSESIALFTQEDFDLSENLVLTVGARYTREEKDIALKTQNEFSVITGSPSPTATNNPCLAVSANVQAAAASSSPFLPAYAGAQKVICGIGAITGPLIADGTYKSDRADEEVTGTIKLAYTTENDTLLFVNVARGFKGGGYNQTRLSLKPTGTSGDNLEFDSEKASTMELGMKTYLADRTVSLNGTLFHTLFEGFQLGQFSGITLETFSVDEVISQGLEVETLWRATDGLTITAGAVYTNNYYPKDSNIDTIAPTTDGNKRADHKMAKEWAATLGATYARPVSDNLLASAHIDARYTGDYPSNSSLDKDFNENAFTVANARLTLSDMGKSWEVELWARNLADTEYSPIRFDPPPIQGRGGNGRIGDFVGEPRTYGLTARKNF
ncbi:MAG: iron complex outermembrane receptor protein [Bermanella sp.]|jgi:iron complex outermembrane receptor protein